MAVRPLTRGWLVVALLTPWAEPVFAQQSATLDAAPTIVHAGVLGTYNYWDGQGSGLEDSDWGYGGTFKFLTGTTGGTRLGMSVTWVRNGLDTGSGGYQADGRTFIERLTMDRTAVDFLYGLPENRNGNVPYFLAGGGRLQAEGDTAAGDTASLSERFWEVGVGIVNGQSDALAFALEAKYLGTWGGQEVRSDDGLVELSMSVGYNW
jgi:hypothetical protein